MAKTDTALSCLVQIAKHFSIPSEVSQMERAYITDKQAVDTVTLILAARELGLKARAYENVALERLGQMPLPAICRMKDGIYVLVTQVDGEKVVLFNPALEEGRQLLAAKSDFFRQHWSGEVVLFARRYALKKSLEKVQKFLLDWAKEHNVTEVTAVEMKIINDKRSKEKGKG